MVMQNDVDPVETREWLDALGSVLAFEGADRARFLLGELASEGRRRGAPAPYSATTPYLNTMPVDQQPAHRGHLEPPSDGRPPRPHHPPAGTAAGLPGRPGHRVERPLPDPLERPGHGAAGQQGVLGPG